MTDYIRREDALKALYNDYAYSAMDVIKRLPAADVAEVVRCKDCKYGDYDSKSNGAMVCLRTNDGFWRKEMDFCSYGEYQTNTGGNANVSD